MAETQIRFDDGAAYERMMGVGAGLPAKFSSIGRAGVRPALDRHRLRQRRLYRTAD